MPELHLEFLENCTNYFSLHLWRYLLIEIELFNDQVEIVQESIMHKLLNITVQIRRYVVWFIRPLYFLDPYIEHAQLFINQALKVVRFFKHIVNAAHQKREETQTNKLKNVKH